MAYEVALLPRRPISDVLASLLTSVFSYELSTEMRRGQGVEKPSGE